MNNSNEYNALDLSRLRDKLLVISKESGISKWDIGGAYSNDTSVQVDKGEAKQIRSAQRSSITIRVWN